MKAKHGQLQLNDHLPFMAVGDKQNVFNIFKHFYVLCAKMIKNKGLISSQLFFFY